MEGKKTDIRTDLHTEAGLRALARTEASPELASPCWSWPMRLKA